MASRGELPLVSIFMSVRNGADFIRRAIESVRAQTYPNIEFVVQDGASTDGTLDILRSFGSAIALVSEPDNGSNQGFWRALNRCKGEFIGSCLADEELLPDAVERAVELLRKHPTTGAITGDALITDETGATTGFWKSGPFNLIDYLLCDYCPYFVSSFFRRQALLDVGLVSDVWRPDCVEFEIWCRLATRSTIEYVPITFAKYASHLEQITNNTRDVVFHFTGRLRYIISMCSEDGFLGAAPLLRTLFIWNHARTFINHAVAVGRHETAKALYRITTDTLSEFEPVRLGEILYDENYLSRVSARNARNKLLQRIPEIFSFALGQERMKRLADNAEQALFAARYDETARGASPLKALLWARPSQPLPLPPPLDMSVKANLYAQLASRYEAGNQPLQALALWQAIARLAGLPGSPFDLGDKRIGYTHLANVK